MKNSSLLLTCLFCAPILLGIFLRADDPLPPGAVKVTSVDQLKKMDEARQAGEQEEKKRETLVAAQGPQKYDPQNVNWHKSYTADHPFTTTASDFANKNALAQLPSLALPPFPLNGEKSNIGRPYFDPATANNLSNTLSKNSDLSRPYPIPSTPDLAASSNLQNRSTTIVPKSSPFSRTSTVATSYNAQYNHKAYTGPEAALIHKEMQTVAQKLSSMDGLPNRPLTIDEVRDLLNHDVRPGSVPPPSNKAQQTSPQTTDSNANIPIAPAIDPLSADSLSKENPEFLPQH